MKTTILLFFLYLNIFPVFAITTEASNFAEYGFSQKNKSENVHINVKKEYELNYQQQIGTEDIKSLTYGWGDMKICGKKYKITYIVMFDCCHKPYWFSIQFYQ